MPSIKLKDVLAREIKERDLSINQIAKSCGMPKSTLHDWLSGRTPNSKNLHYLYNLAEFFEISLSSLLFNIEEGKEAVEIISSTVFSDGGKTYRIKIEKVSKN